jgi:hypothetical protein
MLPSCDSFCARADGLDGYAALNRSLLQQQGLQQQGSPGDALSAGTDGDGALASFLALASTGAAAGADARAGDAAPAAPSSNAVRASIVGTGARLGAQSSLKDCVVGRRLVVGAKCKVQNCVIMDDVEIADGCVVQNCILCRGVRVGARCHLDRCQVGAGTLVPEKSKMKEQQLAGAAPARDGCPSHGRGADPAADARPGDA